MLWILSFSQPLTIRQWNRTKQSIRHVNQCLKRFLPRDSCARSVRKLVPVSNMVQNGLIAEQLAPTGSDHQNWLRTAFPCVRNNCISTVPYLCIASLLATRPPDFQPTFSVLSKLVDFKEQKMFQDVCQEFRTCYQRNTMTLKGIQWRKTELNECGRSKCVTSATVNSVYVNVGLT